MRDRGKEGKEGRKEERRQEEGERNGEKGGGGKWQTEKRKK